MRRFPRYDYQEHEHLPGLRDGCLRCQPSQRYSELHLQQGAFDVFHTPEADELILLPALRTSPPIGLLTKLHRYPLPSRSLRQRLFPRTTLTSPSIPNQRTPSLSPNTATPSWFNPSPRPGSPTPRCPPPFDCSPHGMISHLHHQNDMDRASASLQRRRFNHRLSRSFKFQRKSFIASRALGRSPRCAIRSPIEYHLATRDAHLLVLYGLILTRRSVIGLRQALQICN